MITIKDIADEAGYSITTVSRVLNNKGEVSPTARAKIESVVQKYQFVPNSNAKNLKQVSGKTIGVIVKGTGNYMFTTMVRTLQQMVAATEYNLFVKYIDIDGDEVLSTIELITERKLIGTLILGGVPDHFRQNFHRVHIPCVLITNSAKDLGYDNLSSVYSDDFKGAYEAEMRLFNYGHEHIGIIGGNLDNSYSSYLRLMGCKKAVEETGRIWQPDKYYYDGKYSLEGGYLAANILMTRIPELTAFFCMSDIMAAGACRALADRGLKVPDDISVFAYDGTEVSRFYVPRMASVRQETVMMANQGFTILLDMIENNAPATHLMTPITLLRGESVRNLNKEK